MAPLEARELYRFFHTGDDEVIALRGVDVTINAGEMVALVGPSGSGKSTLLMCLAGLDEPDGGQVTVCSETMTRRPEIEKTKLRSQYCGVMLQRENLFAHLTVSENMRAAQSLHGLPDEVFAASILDRIHLENRANSLPAQLSGGEKARASLAVALSRKPVILLLDEPTGEVDAHTESQILAVLEEHRIGGGAIIVATHNSTMSHASTRVIAMKDGRIIHG
jgi:putative ABC transport system ATP-binding protein